jgi:hypothetical protein
MAASMVNIADFRCRRFKNGRDDAPVRAVENHGGLSGVEPEPSVDECETSLAENPGVLDIGAARDSQRVRQRMGVHAAPVLRQMSGVVSNLVRFDEPQVAVMRIKQTRPMEGWAQDDCDHPPAA